MVTLSLSREHCKHGLTGPYPTSAGAVTPPRRAAHVVFGLEEYWVRKRGGRKERPVVPFTLNFMCRRVPFDIQA